ncbi:hypothetical protein CDD83_4276 [Cordyceps sp. RAO-2017]|nr:hypothetical protein CDD83_4276 [Cordyceps sp. RAO-2017]
MVIVRIPVEGRTCGAELVQTPPNLTRRRPRPRGGDVAAQAPALDLDSRSDEQDPLNNKPCHQDAPPSESRLDICHTCSPAPPGESKSKPSSGRRKGAYPRPFPRISKPVELMRLSYDCVVIGSGYGAGVAASRMARAGESVCLLERGEERWPGEYPESLGDAAKQFHCSGRPTPGLCGGGFVDSGNPMGMYHLILGQGQSAVVCNGLGGTSLINANVFLEADASTLAMDVWPPQIRQDPDCLARYYQKVRETLEPEQYPDHWPTLKKAAVFRHQAESLGMSDRLYRVPQTTRFRQGPNSCGVNMSASTLTGQDAMGINDGSKTTTLVTYLADAWNWGADMFCQCEARHIERVEDARGGYLVYFSWRGRGRDRFRDGAEGELMWVHARKAVFLGAGAVGTTEILLRSKSMGLGISDCVGQGMSGNGDMLAFGYNADCEVNAVGNPSPCPRNPVGPTISTAIDCRGEHGFIIQEGAIPQPFSEFLRAVLDLVPGEQVAEGEGLLGRVQAVLSGWKTKLLGPYAGTGVMERTQVFLIMSRDGGQGTLRLEDGKPVLELPVTEQSDQAKKLNALLARATEMVGGTLVLDPLCAGQGVTVHPLGTGSTGVTNHAGEVFTGNNTRRTHPGLIVTDGAVVPAALGVNPAATIAALAERAVAEYARENNLTVSEERNDVLDLYGKPAHGPRSRETDGSRAEADKMRIVERRLRAADQGDALDFTELLYGFVHSGPGVTANDDKAAFGPAYRTAKSRGEAARLLLSVIVLDACLHGGGIVTGTFVCPTIEGSPFMILRGDMSLLKPDQQAPGTRTLTYSLPMTGINGRRLCLRGRKVVDSSVALDPRELWRATTTLYVTISEPTPESHIRWKAARSGMALTGGRRRPLAMGIMHIGLGDFLSEVLTLTATGKNLLDRARGVAKFVSHFSCEALPAFLTPLAPLQYAAPEDEACGSIRRDTGPTHSHVIEASDGVRTELHVWEPAPGAVATDEAGVGVETENLLMIPGAAVDHQMFALPTVPVNAVDYFTRAGYRVFVAVHRICKGTTGQGQWTTYDARLDVRASLEHIRRRHGRVYAVAHCLGALALASGLLDGSIPAQWLEGITCSQVLMHPLWEALNMVKVRLPLDRLYTLLAGRWFECATSTDDSLVQQALNQLLRLYPQERRELCSSAACHRATLLFGRCWSHGNLNEATHRHLDRLLGGANMTLLDLLVQMGRRGTLLANGPGYQELATADNVRRLRGLPILLFTGGDNAVLSPLATERSYESLRDVFGVQHCRRRLVPGYGHLDCWMGRNAWRDVFPLVRREVDRVLRGEAYRFRPPCDGFTPLMEESAAAMAEP